MQLMSCGFIELLGDVDFLNAKTSRIDQNERKTDQSRALFIELILKTPTRKIALHNSETFPRLSNK